MRVPAAMAIQAASSASMRKRQLSEEFRSWTLTSRGPSRARGLMRRLDTSPMMKISVKRKKATSRVPMAQVYLLRNSGSPVSGLTRKRAVFRRTLPGISSKTLLSNLFSNYRQRKTNSRGHTI